MAKRLRRHPERAARLRVARKRRGLTQERVVEAMQGELGGDRPTQSHYSAWENGYKWPEDEDTLRALGAALNVSYAWLTFGEAEGVIPPEWAKADPRPPLREAQLPGKIAGKIAAKRSRGA